MIKAIDMGRGKTRVIIETASLPDAVCAGVEQLEGLDISNRRQAASLWHDTAVAALDADPRAGRLVRVKAHRARRGRECWLATPWRFRAGVFATAASLTEEEQQALIDANHAGMVLAQQYADLVAEYLSDDAEGVAI